MSVQAYQSLIDQLCQHAGIDHPASMYAAAELAINGTKFMLRHGGRRAPHMALAYCAFGPLATSQRELALQRLLETNVVLFGTPGSPFFSYNPDSKEVLLTCSIFLAEASGSHLLELLTTFSVVAQDWRSHYFLTENVMARRSPTAATGVQAARHSAMRHLSPAVATAPQR